MLQFKGCQTTYVHYNMKFLSRFLEKHFNLQVVNLRYLDGLMPLSKTRNTEVRDQLKTVNIVKEITTLRRETEENHENCNSYNQISPQYKFTALRRGRKIISRLV